VNFTAFLASNLIAQFSRQIVVQILDLESPKVCGNLAVRSLKLSLLKRLKILSIIKSSSHEKIPPILDFPFLIN
jgi:hypothetical protein